MEPLNGILEPYNYSLFISLVRAIGKYLHLQDLEVFHIGGSTVKAVLLFIYTHTVSCGRILHARL